MNQGHFLIRYNLERTAISRGWATTRLAYYELPSYVPLMRRSYELWRELERESGERLPHLTGSVDAGPEASEVFGGSLRSCLEHGLPHEVLDHRELARRFPGYRLPESHLALLQAEGGFFLSERCIISQVALAQRRGAGVRARERVLSWRSSPNHVEVETERGRYEAGNLVLTAGPWAAALEPELGASAQPERQVLGWFQPRRSEFFSPERFPVFNLLVEEGRYYGFPIYGIPGLKIGHYHHLEEEADPDILSGAVSERDEAVLRACVAQYFPEANGPVMTLKTCMFTNSPDEHFIIGPHPEAPNVVLAAGFSGNGFKFCSVVGEMLSDLALGGRTAYRLECSPLHGTQPPHSRACLR